MKHTCSFALFTLIVLCGCQDTTQIASIPTQHPIQQETHSETYYPLRTRADIDAIPKGYGVKGYSRWHDGVNDIYGEDNKGLALLTDKDMEKAYSYLGGSVPRGWFDVVPPQMIVPLDGSEGKPLYLKLLFRPVKKVDMTKYMNQSPVPKYITKCHTYDGETTCTTY